MLLLSPLRFLARSLAMALLVSLVVANWLVVKGSRAVHGALRKLCR